MCASCLLTYLQHSCTRRHCHAHPFEREKHYTLLAGKADLWSAHWCLVALGLQDRSVHRVVHATQAVMHIMHAVLAALASSSDQQKPVPQATSCGKQEAALAYKWPKQNTANQERLPYRTKQYRHTSCVAKQMNGNKIVTRLAAVQQPGIKAQHATAPTARPQGAEDRQGQKRNAQVAGG